MSYILIEVCICGEKYEDFRKHRKKLKSQTTLRKTLNKRDSIEMSLFTRIQRDILKLHNFPLLSTELFLLNSLQNPFSNHKENLSTLVTKKNCEL